MVFSIDHHLSHIGIPFLMWRCRLRAARVGSDGYAG